MGLLNRWIDAKLAEIANKLPSLVHQDAASFACGYNTGYKNALLDLEKRLNHICEVIQMPKKFQDIYQTREQILEAMQW